MFRDLGDFAVMVKDRKFLTGRAATLFASATVASDGGYAVPTDFAADLFLRDENSLAALCQTVPSNSGEIQIPVDESAPWESTGILAEWANEGQASTQRKPKLTLASHKLKKLTVLCPVPEELASDAPALQAWFPAAMRRATNWKMAEAIVNGIGAGRPLGILRSDAVITVDKEGGQSAGTITNGNIRDMLDRALEPATSTWLINPTCYGQITTLSAFDGGTGKLAGLPIVTTPACAVKGSCGDLILMARKSYRLVTRELKFANSAHLWFDQDIQCFKLTIRIDGQPILRAPTTLPGASVTSSHFVTLAERA